MAEVKRRTETPCWKLTLQPEGPCGLLDSKVGGLPYWDPALPYPTDSQGNKMTLLAQLNFAQLGTEDPLPRAGMLYRPQWINMPNRASRNHCTLAS